MPLPLLPLPRASRVLYLIGLAGVGKSYVGDLIGARAGYHVYHADGDLPEEMREAVARNEPWTEEQIDAYYRIIRDRILELGRLHDKIVVTQATYFQKHRDLMTGSVPGLEILWIVADSEVNLQRIRERKDFVTVEYFEATKPYFEAPPAETKRIVNDGGDAGDNAIVRQLLELFGSG